MNGFDGPDEATTRPGFADAARFLPDHELDRRIQTGWDEWCELADALLNTAGLLPSPELAGRVINFFDHEYWRPEDARIEALRRR